MLASSSKKRCKKWWNIACVRPNQDTIKRIISDNCSNRPKILFGIFISVIGIHGFIKGISLSIIVLSMVFIYCFHSIPEATLAEQRLKKTNAHFLTYCAQVCMNTGYGILCVFSYISLLPQLNTMINQSTSWYSTQAFALGLFGVLHIFLIWRNNSIATMTAAATVCYFLTI